uniref:ApbA_C domain-containing protein n=1 Tax=Panagrellus redivivus TaxID=6233 RepID=A0A7E4VRC9_PANRE
MRQSKDKLTVIKYNGDGDAEFFIKKDPACFAANEGEDGNNNQVDTKLYTIIIMGTSDFARTLLFDAVCLIDESETSIAATERASQTVSLQTKSMERMIVNGTSQIRLVNFPLIASDLRISTNVMSRLSKYPEIHAIIMTIQNGNLELPIRQQNEVSFMYSLILRRAFYNCCIVNVFEPTDSFDSNAASAQLSTFLEQFTQKHCLTQPSMNSFCFNIGDLKQSIIHEDPLRVATKLFRSVMYSLHTAFLSFFKTVKNAPPITPSDLTLVSKIKRLETMLSRRIDNPSGHVRRLMAIVQQHSLTDFAVYCRNNANNVTPFDQHDWKKATDYWGKVNVRITSILTYIEYLLYL